MTNREIKFRIFTGKKMIFGPTDDNPNSSWILAVAPTIDYPVQQYTGLKDENNKDIYEGDIVKALSSDNKYLSEVIWDEREGRWGFKSINLKHNNRNISYNLDFGCSAWKIIGNIYETPELLK